MEQQVPKYALLELDWNFVKGCRFEMNPIPFTKNFHILLIDEEEDLKGMWLLENARRVGYEER